MIDLMADEVGTTFDSEPLRRSLSGVRYRELSIGSGDGQRDERWHIISNVEIEHDL